MPISSEKLRKLVSLTEGSVHPRPLPQVPKFVMSEGDRARMPSLAEAFDRYNEEWERFVKEQRTGG